MGKSTNFTGQPVFGQLLKLLNKQKIQAISRSTGQSEHRIRKLNGYTHLVTMLFGILKHFDSLRELEIGLQAEANKIRHLGIDYIAKRSTLSEANYCCPVKEHGWILGKTKCNKTRHLRIEKEGFEKVSPPIETN